MYADMNNGIQNNLQNTGIDKYLKNYHLLQYLWDIFCIWWFHNRENYFELWPTAWFIIWCLMIHAINCVKLLLWNAQFWLKIVQWGVLVFHRKLNEVDKISHNTSLLRVWELAATILRCPLNTHLLVLLICHIYLNYSSDIYWKSSKIQKSEVSSTLYYFHTIFGSCKSACPSCES